MTTKKLNKRQKTICFWILGVALALIVSGVAYVTSYAVSKHFYGISYSVTSTQTITIENGGQKVTMDEVEYEVTDVNPYPYNTNFYIIYLHSNNYTGFILVPMEIYDRAVQGAIITNSVTLSTETRPIDTSPFAISIGTAAGIVVMAGLSGYQAGVRKRGVI